MINAMSDADVERIARRVVEMLKGEPSVLAPAGHQCTWCPVEVRDLAACAHNAVVHYGTGSERHKMADLKDAVTRYEPALAAHFTAIKP